MEYQKPKGVDEMRVPKGTLNRAEDIFKILNTHMKRFGSENADKIMGELVKKNLGAFLGVAASVGEIDAVLKNLEFAPANQMKVAIDPKEIADKYYRNVLRKTILDLKESDPAGWKLMSMGKIDDEGTIDEHLRFLGTEVENPHPFVRLGRTK